jgi:glyceraldehyde 3-phosphate dehydrogenase
MINVGINGFGRIGKCLFLQLMTNDNIVVKAINIPDFDIQFFEHYLKTDSNHSYNKKWTVKIINDNQVRVDGNLITILNSRYADGLKWTDHDIDYLIDTTGVFLTKEKAEKHKVPYFIMCAPPKDDTPQFMVNANEDKYRGENIVSNASCTSNCLIPVLKFLDNKYTIIDGNFTTIHAATASQKTTDTTKMNKRTCRSIFNNIIPHTTGASKSIGKILPNLDGKLVGASVRVPVSNVSLVNLNVRLETNTTINEIINDMKNENYIKIESKPFMVSSDFMTTTCPSIIDVNGSMDLNNNQFKLVIWYDNEWSYVFKVVCLLEHMIKNNKLTR